MIEKIDSISNSTKLNSINLSKGDILTVTFDQDIWTLDEASSFAKCITEMFPNNSVICLFKGMELGVIKNDNLY